MNKKTILTCLAISAFSQADIGVNILQYYKNKIFVNTGIGASMNFAQALHTEFTTLLLIDKNPILTDHFNAIAQRMVNNLNIKKIPRLYKSFCLASHSELNTVIKNYREPITFLLSSIIPEYGDEYNHDSNILMELDQIKSHPIKTHTILIDYIQHAGSKAFNFTTLAQIQEKLLSINRRYKFKFETGGYLGQEANAILVAYLA